MYSNVPLLFQENWEKTYSVCLEDGMVRIGQKQVAGGTDGLAIYFPTVPKVVL